MRIEEEIATTRRSLVGVKCNSCGKVLGVGDHFLHIEMEKCYLEKHSTRKNEVMVDWGAAQPNNIDLCSSCSDVLMSVVRSQGIKFDEETHDLGDGGNAGF